MDTSDAQTAEMQAIQNVSPQRMRLAAIVTGIHQTPVKPGHAHFHIQVQQSLHASACIQLFGSACMWLYGGYMPHFPGV